MQDLYDALRAAGQSAIDRDGLLQEDHLLRAYASYANYFELLEAEPDREPPTSPGPAYDLLLVTLWDVLVDREEEELDEHLVGPWAAYPSHEALYAAVFRRLVNEEPADAPPDTDGLGAILRQIGEEVGLRIDPHVDHQSLPQEVAERLEQLTATGDVDRLVTTIAELKKKHPGSLLLQSLHVQLLPSPAAVVEYAADWGQPIDPRRVVDLPAERALSLLEYLTLERMCLTVYAARLERYHLLQSLQRLLLLDQVTEYEDSRLAYFISSHMQAGMQAGRMLPTSWQAPAGEADFLDASTYLQKRWEETVEELSGGLSSMFAGQGLTEADFDVPQGRYQIKVSLRGIRPPIWRRLIVPAAIELADLHHVIQAAMGWDNGHLHAFETAMDTYGPGDDPYSEDESYEGLTLNILMQKPKHKIGYTYDFGDNWEHDILLEKVLPAEQGAGPSRQSAGLAGASQVQCITGKRACPPEDCGGVGGYYAILDALKDPEQEDNAELLEWLGDDFDPEAFDPTEGNTRLAQLQR